MIMEETVFVFGAGLSSDYGFPTDQQLRDKIIDDTKWIEVDGESILSTDKISLFLQMGFTQDELVKFRQGLQIGKFDTIDQFLETRRNDSSMVSIGKTAIAMALLSYEDKGKFDTGFTDNCFYRFLFNKMAEGSSKETFKENRVTIVTYNYDRSFEFFLWSSLIHRYGIKESEADQIMNNIKIIHIHGMIGKMHWQDPNFVDYGNNKDEVKCEDLILAKEGIVTFNEIDESNNTYREVHNGISEVENIVFVGFGFDKVNLSRLMDTGCLTPDKRVIATAYKINTIKINEISGLTKSILNSGNMVNLKASSFGNEHLTWL